MLKNAQPKLQSDIEDILKDALYEAYMTQYKESGNTIIDGFTQASMTTSAKEFSEKASKLIGKPLSKAIYDFVKEIAINVQPKSLSDSQLGPVAGKISQDEFIIS